MEITKSALCEAYASVTDFEKLPFYYENGRLFPVIQYFHSQNILYLIFQSISQILHKNPYLLMPHMSTPKSKNAMGENTE